MPARPGTTTAGAGSSGRLGADYRDGVLAELCADLGDDVEVIATGVRVGWRRKPPRVCPVEHRLGAVPESQRRIEVRHCLSGGQFQQFQRRFPREPFQRPAAEVDEPMLLELGERPDVGLQIDDVLGGASKNLRILAIARTRVVSRHDSSIEVRLDVMAKPESLVRSGM